MELYLDTANLTDIERLARIYPISGVTTNPSIVARNKQPLRIVLPKIQEIIGENGKLFAQVISAQSTDMINEAKALRKLIPSIIIKVPVTPEGLIAIRELKNQEIPTLGTVVYNSIQGLMAALAGAEYIAPYVNRVDSQGGSGIQLVSELCTLIDKHQLTCKILAASFKTPKQVLDCMLVGAQAVTVPTDIIDQFLNIPSVHTAIQQFDSDWDNAFNGIFLD